MKLVIACLIALFIAAHCWLGAEATKRATSFDKATDDYSFGDADLTGDTTTSSSEQQYVDDEDDEDGLVEDNVELDEESSAGSTSSSRSSSNSDVTTTPYSCPSECHCTFERLADTADAEFDYEDVDDYDEDATTSTTRRKRKAASVKYDIRLDCSSQGLDTISNLFDYDFPLDRIVSLYVPFFYSMF
jgi:hypothetical protein